MIRPAFDACFYFVHDFDSCCAAQAGAETDMTVNGPSGHYSPDPNVLERKASEYLRSARERGSIRRSPLQAEDLATIRRIRRSAVGWAFASGTVYGGVIGGAEIFLRLIVLDDPDLSQWREHLPTWAAFYAFIGLLTVMEILFLYWNSLRAIVKFGRVIDVPFAGDSHADLLTSGLARSALEMPNPWQKIYGVDPYALLSRRRLMARYILYKMKVGATSFVIRVLMRRVLTRAALRGYIPLLAIPLYAVWNAFITWRVLNEAWLRAIGPFVVDRIRARVSKSKESASEEGRETILQGVGEMIRQSGDAHPNHVLLLSQLIEDFETKGDGIEVDWTGRSEKVQALTGEERSTLLTVLMMTSVLAGKPRKAQREFLRKVHGDCDAEYSENRLKTLRTDLMKGYLPPTDGSDL